MNLAEKLHGRSTEDSNLVQLSILGTSLVSERCRLSTQILTRAAAQLGYYIFHTYDPGRPKQHVALLLGLPAALSLVLYQLTSRLLHSIGTAFAAYWALLLCFTGLYRISPFHRLAAFPGPLGAKLSKVWMTFIMAEGKISLYYRDLHRQYGDVVRVGTWTHSSMFIEYSISHRYRAERSERQPSRRRAICSRRERPAQRSL